MSNTLIFDAGAFLSTSTVSRQVLVDSVWSMSSEDYDLQVNLISQCDSVSFIGGSKGTLISTNLSNEDTIQVTFGGVSYDLGSLLILPGGVGSIEILNNLSTETDVRVEAVVVN